MTINVNAYVCMFPHSLVHETINFVYCLHACICCLDSGDPYRFCVGDGLDPCAFGWAWCVGEDGIEADVNCLDPFGAPAGSDALKKPPLISVQGRLKQHEEFWLDELEPSSFVKRIITEGYRLPFLRLPDAVFHAVKS